MTADIETANIFFANVNSDSGKSIYDFFIAQQDYTNKLLRNRIYDIWRLWSPFFRIPFSDKKLKWRPI